MNIRSIVKSFSYAIEGFLNCIKFERNFRIHLVAIVYVLFFSFFYKFSKLEYIILIFAFCMVLFAEMVNTAIENLIDLESKSYNKLAKNAKDIAAGAVLVCAIGAAIIGIILFLDINVITSIIYFFIKEWWYFIALIISIILSCMFINFKRR